MSQFREGPWAAHTNKNPRPAQSRSGAGDQYSSASMIVSTRVVFNTSAGSS